jgi:hypothetical protein
MKNLILPLIVSVAIISCTDRSVQNESSQKDNPEIKLREVSESIDSSELRVAFPGIPAGTITVGGPKADIIGFNSAAIQTAIDALRARGSGGTIELNSGTFDITAPVKLYSNMWLKGSGAETILRKCSGVSSPFALDADYGELQVTVADASAFKPGMGVAIYDDTQRSGWDLTTARITAISGNVIYLDDYLLRDYYKAKGGTISNACSVVEAVSAENVVISDLVIEGGKETNDLIDGCRAGGIYLHKVRKALVENVIVKDFRSDGISWQITEHVTVRNCEVTGCTNSGLHPGTGSPYSVIEGNNSHHNEGYGLFVCWRVRNGAVRNNSFHDNGINGISTGHKDTDMLFADNHIFNNGEDGITLRGEAENNEPDGTIIRHNIIENNGVKEGGYAISIYSPAERVLVENNIIRNTVPDRQKAAVYVSERGLQPEMVDNEISSMPEGEIVKSEK